jgi:hypothetical protein
MQEYIVMIVFKFPDLKGYVTLEDGKIECHDADPELVYMKDLVSKAQNVKDNWDLEPDDELFEEA